MYEKLQKVIDEIQDHRIILQGDLDSLTISAASGGINEYIRRGHLAIKTAAQLSVKKEIATHLQLIVSEESTAKDVFYRLDSLAMHHVREALVLEGGNEYARRKKAEMWFTHWGDHEKSHGLRYKAQIATWPDLCRNLRCRSRS